MNNEVIIKVVKNIPGFQHITGKSFPLSEFKEKFPYFDINSDFVSKEYPAKYEIGDFVKFGESPLTFKVISVDNLSPSIHYNIETINCSNKYARYDYVLESYLSPLKIIYVLDLNNIEPHIIEIDEETFKNKYEGTAMTMFCSYDRNFAQKMLKVFNTWDMHDIVYTMMDNADLLEVE